MGIDVQIITEQDRINAVLLARIGMLQGIIMLMLRDHPDRIVLKRDAQFLLNADEMHSLYSSISDLQAADLTLAREQTFRAVFCESPTKTSDSP